LAKAMTTHEIEANIRVSIWAMYPFLKKKQIGIINHDLLVENNPWNKKIRVDYIDKLMQLISKHLK
jgi:hypothetical protein